MPETHTIIIREPLVAIVGRTNVGKSTLFNRLTEGSRALVSGIPGTTRSPNYGEFIWRGSIATAVDTGGLEKRPEDPFEADIRRQAERAIRDADIILFLVDLRIGLTPEDRGLAKLLIRSRKPVILVGNKAERQDARERASAGAWRAFGAGECFPISATTGVGVGDLLDEVWRRAREIGLEPKTIEEELQPIRVVIVGKPNVGKSSLLNSLVGEERALVSEIAHTTREPQDTLMYRDGTYYLFVDTAGIRKKMKIAPGLEATGVKKTLASIRRAEIALFMIDPVEGIGAPDRHIAGLLKEAAAGVILVANKWDLVPDKTPHTEKTVRELVLHALPFLGWAPIVAVSAKTGQHVAKLFSAITRVAAARMQEVPAKTLDTFFRTTLRKHRPVGRGVKHPYIYDMKQVEVAPPTFMLSVRGRRESVHPSYLRFLERKLREAFDFEGAPIVIKSKAIRPTV